MKKDNVEIEARFLDVDPVEIHKKLTSLHADDKGEDFFREIIFYDKALTWKDIFKFFRMRTSKKGTFLTLKHFQYSKEGKGLYTSDKPVVKEVEVIVDSPEKTQALLEEAGFLAFRIQEKKRHSYILDGVIVDVDTWPSTPSYVEIEGDSEQKIRKVAERMGFEWTKAVFRGAGWIIEQYLDVSVRDLKYLTFKKIE